MRKKLACDKLLAFEMILRMCLVVLNVSGMKRKTDMGEQQCCKFCKNMLDVTKLKSGSS